MSMHGRYWLPLVYIATAVVVVAIAILYALEFRLLAAVLANTVLALGIVIFVVRSLTRRRLAARAMSGAAGSINNLALGRKPDLRDPSEPAGSQGAFFSTDEPSDSSRDRAD